jgi:hypothetical protein
MKKHESGCTLNPNRVCRVCKMVQGVQEPIEILIALLPKLSESERNAFGPESDNGHQRVNAALPSLRKACTNCPACILAALRQAKIPVPIASDFNWTNEMKAVWAVLNKEQYEGVQC